ncbi:MAG: LURP-one-related/scramblase family protein [Thermoplasmataceae archaeon]
MTQQAYESVIKAVGNHSEILMKKKIIALGKHYNVMDKEKNTLCSVHLSLWQNMGGEAMSRYVGKWLGRSMKYTYEIKDDQDNIALEVRKYSGGWTTSFEVVEPDSNNVIGKIWLKRKFLTGGMKAMWVDKGSENPLITVKGNIMRRKYRMLSPDGKEIAKVRHKVVAVRDVWKIQINDPKHNLEAIIFAAVLDFEKEM